MAKELNEFYLLNLLFDRWNTARISTGNRPDFDVQFRKGGLITNYEVKTQGKYGDNESNAFIEIGEVNTTGNKNIPVGEFNYKTWYKSALLLSESNRYIVCKKRSDDIYDIYEIEKKTLLEKINDYIEKNLKSKIIYQGDKFKLKSNITFDLFLQDLQNGYIEKKLRYLNDRRYDGSYMIANNKDLNNDVVGTAITWEEGRINFCLVVNLNRITTKNIFLNQNIKSDPNDIAKYFSGLYINKGDNTELDYIKDQYANDPDFTNDDILDITNTWKYDLNFNKKVNQNNLNLKQIMDFSPVNHVLQYIEGITPIKNLGLEGNGASGDTSGSSSESEEERKDLRTFFNKLTNKIKSTKK